MNARVSGILLAAGWLSLAGPVGSEAQTGGEQADRSAPMSIDQALDRALTELRVAEAHGPGYQEAFKKARQHVNYVLDRDKFHRRGQYYKARLLILADRGKDALGTLQRWTDSPQGQNDWEAHLLLGRLYNTGGFYKLAKPSIRQALTLNPREPRIYLELANCEMSLLNFSEAAGHVREAIRILGDDTTASEYARLAQILALDKQPDQAEAQAMVAVNVAAEALREQESTVPALELLRESLTLLLRIKEAKLDANPADVDLYLDISSLIQEQANVTMQLKAHEALRWSLRGLDAAKDETPTPLLLDAIRLCLRLGKTDQALAFTRKVLEVSPDNAEAREILRALAPPDDDLDSPAPVELNHQP